MRVIHICTYCNRHEPFTFSSLHHGPKYNMCINGTIHSVKLEGLHWSITWLYILYWHCIQLIQNSLTTDPWLVSIATRAETFWTQSTIIRTEYFGQVIKFLGSQNMKLYRENMYFVWRIKLIYFINEVPKIVTIDPVSSTCLEPSVK